MTKMTNHTPTDLCLPVAETEAYEAVRTILRYIGEDPSREGLMETPRRFIAMLKGLKATFDEEIEATTFALDGYNDLVIICAIPFYSFCEHHCLPYLGKIDIGYLPNGTVLGLSKFARIVQKLQAGLTIQEKLTRDIAITIADACQCEDIAVISEATHTCVVTRGAKAYGSTTIASVMLGGFRESSALRSEFLRLVGR